MKSKSWTNISLVKTVYAFFVFYYILTFDERTSPLAFINKTINFKYIFLFGAVLLFIAAVKGKVLVHLFKKELSCIFNLCLFFCIISIALMLMNNGFKVRSDYLPYLVSDLFYLMSPCLFVFLLFNTDRRTNPDFYFNCILIASWMNLVLCFSNSLNLAAIKTINFASSHSPFESDAPSFVIFCYFFYFFRKDYKKTIISFVFLFLSFKRIELLASLAFVPFLLILKDRFYTFRINKIVNIVSCVLFIIVSIIICYVCKSEILALLYGMGIDLKLITTGRTSIIGIIVNDSSYKTLGLGTTNFITTGSIHSDLAKIYLETGIVGISVFSYAIFNFVKINKFNIMVHLVVLYRMISFAGTHSLDMFLVNLCFYLFLASIAFYTDHEGKRGMLIND